MSRKGSNEVCEGVVELVFVCIDVAVGGCIAGDHMQTAVSRRSEMGRQEIRAREADGSNATPSIRLLSLRPLHNMVELATVLVPEPGQRTSVRAMIDR